MARTKEGKSLERAFNALNEKMVNAFNQAMNEYEHDAVDMAGRIMNEAVRLAPLDTGALRASAFVYKPRKTRDGFYVPMGFTAPYAFYQHERLDYAHRYGEAKFLEKAIARKTGQWQATLSNTTTKQLRANLKVPIKVSVTF